MLSLSYMKLGKWGLVIVPIFDLRKNESNIIKVYDRYLRRRHSIVYVEGERIVILNTLKALRKFIKELEIDIVDLLKYNFKDILEIILAHKDIRSPILDFNEELSFISKK